MIPPVDTTQRYAQRDRHFPRKDETGQVVCRWCRKPIAKGVYCCEEHKVEVDVRCGFSVPYYLHQRDNGVCADCGINTHELDAALNDLLWTLKKYDAYYWNNKNLFWEISCACGLAGEFKTTENFHHVKPVEEGGGCCGLENYITLCIRCHKIRHSKKNTKANCPTPNCTGCQVAVCPLTGKPRIIMSREVAAAKELKQTIDDWNSLPPAPPVQGTMFDVNSRGQVVKKEDEE